MQASVKSPALPTNSRGARFLDLVKQNIIVSPQLVKKCSQKNLVKPKLGEDDGREYFKLSTGPPYNPDASPVSSILSKRRSQVPVTPDSPWSSAKRKRVGFMDPVVSSTKEYVITKEEKRSKSESLIRCLQYESVEDDEELEKEVILKLEQEEAIDVNGVLTSDEECNHPSPQSTSEEPIESTGAKLTFKDKAELLDYVTKNLSVDELFERLNEAEEKSLKREELVRKVVKTVGISDLLNEYITINKFHNARMTNEQNNLIMNLLGELSNLMGENKQVMHKVLDTFSQQYNEDFLDQALRTNSTGVVCDKIGIANVISYLIHKVNTTDTDEHDALTTTMHRAMVIRLINETNNGTAIAPDRKKAQELLFQLFKNTPKMEIFDTVQDFIRDLLH